MSRVDLMLGEPHPNSPSEIVRWEYMRTVIQQVTNIALDAAPSWITGTTTLTVSDGQDIYNLVANDFGKPILVETSDDTDPYHSPRPIPMTSWASEIVNSDNTANTPIWVSNTGGYTHTARAFAFRREPGILYVRVLPKPTATATYRIYYETASPNDSSLDNIPFMPYVNSYIVAATSAALLPLCKWTDMEAMANVNRQATMMKTLAPMVAQLERETRRILATDKQQGKLQSRGFDDLGYLSDQNP